MSCRDSVGTDKVTNSGNERAGAAVAPLMELTIMAGIQLEKLRADLPFDPKPIERLGTALARASSPSGGGNSVAFVEPGYLRPFRHLYLLARAGERPSASEVKNFMERIAGRFTSLPDSSPDLTEAGQLIDVCIHLHRALRNDLRRQETATGHEWNSFNSAAKESRVTA